jgi:predicted acylesterase/phospholipase RssA
MRARPALLLGALLLVGSTRPVAAQAATCVPARTALVLGGGGAKGLTHLGVLQALDSLGIVPDLIVGSSMGAVIGALYAAGESPASIRERIRASRLDAVIHAYDPVLAPALVGLPAAVVWERSPTRWVLQSGAVREAEANAILSALGLRANLVAGGDFDRLPIPFRAVATDLATREVVVLDRGDLAEALRASMGVPVLLRPVVREGRVLVDGGIGSNTPVRIARALGAERVLVSSVTSPAPDLSEASDPLAVTNALFEFLWVQDSVAPRVDDVVMRHPTATFGMIDFRSATIDSLVQVGRRTADAALRGAACVRPARAARAPLPPLEGIGTIEVTARFPADAELVRRRLAIRAHAPLDSAALRAGLGRLARSDKIQAAWLTPTRRADSLDLAVQVTPAPAQRVGMGVAFDHTMSGRLWMGGVHHRVRGTALEGTVLATAGTYRRDLTAALRRQVRVGSRLLPMGVAIDGVVEDVRRYAGVTELPTVSTESYALFAGVRPLYEGGWTQELGLDWRLWRQPGRPLGASVGARYALRHRRAGVPSPRVTLEAIALNDWQRVRIELTHRDTIAGMTIEPRLRLGAGRALPVQDQFVLGGLDGFAGLPLLAVRGDHEAFASVVLRLPLVRRLQVRVEPMVGVLGVGGLRAGPGTYVGDLLGGVRAGLELETPLGPIRVEEGFSGHGPRQALIRVGYWF